MSPHERILRELDAWKNGEKIMVDPDIFLLHRKRVRQTAWAFVGVAIAFVAVIVVMLTLNSDTQQSIARRTPCATDPHSLACRLDAHTRAQSLDHQDACIIVIHADPRLRSPIAVRCLHYLSRLRQRQAHHAPGPAKHAASGASGGPTSSQPASGAAPPSATTGSAPGSGSPAGPSSAPSPAPPSTNPGGSGGPNTPGPPGKPGPPGPPGPPGHPPPTPPPGTCVGSTCLPPVCVGSTCLPALGLLFP